MVLLDCGVEDICKCCGKRVTRVPWNITSIGIPHMCYGSIRVTNEEIPRRKIINNNFISELKKKE